MPLSFGLLIPVALIAPGVAIVVWLLLPAAFVVRRVRRHREEAAA
jgi:hypothetical protein